MEGVNETYFENCDEPDGRRQREEDRTMSKHETELRRRRASGESVKAVARWYLEHWGLIGIQELADVRAFEERFLDVSEQIDMSEWPHADVMVVLNFGVLDRRHDDETGSAIAELTRRADAKHTTAGNYVDALFSEHGEIRAQLRSYWALSPAERHRFAELFVRRMAGDVDARIECPGCPLCRGEIQVRIMVPAIIDSEPKSKVDQAVAELRQTGYEVFRRPAPRLRVEDPPSESLEIIAPGPDSPGKFRKAIDSVLIAVLNEVNAIVEKHGGMCWMGSTVVRTILERGLLRRGATAMHIHP
jgi:hypothetical protein